MSYVVDASVAVKWVVPETSSEHADLLLASSNELLAPDLMLIEASNALWRKVIRNELSAGEADRAFALLSASGLIIRPTVPLLPRAAQLARRISHPVHDCVYLALAEQERVPVVTADERLIRDVSRRKLRVRVLALGSV